MTVEDALAHELEKGVGDDNDEVFSDDQSNNDGGQATRNAEGAAIREEATPQHNWDDEENI